VRRDRPGRVVALMVAVAGVVGAPAAAWLVAAAPVTSPSTTAPSSSDPARTSTAARASTTTPGGPAETFVAPPPAGVPPAGEATTYGCAAARAYLAAYAAPGFAVQCPGYAQGHQAETMCAQTVSPCDTQRLIVIADPCPVAYMNEAANSWVLSGVSDAPIDPYGACA
jgi:hypothetical protein